MDHFWLSDAQFAKIAPHLPTDTRGKERVDDCRVISGIIHVLKSGGRWSDAPRDVYGPKKTLYLRGSRLEAVYPVSIPAHGMALNITLFSYADTINVGFVGCRDTLPHLQRLAVNTGEAFADLDKAVG